MTPAPIATARLHLTVTAVDDAPDLAAALSDPALHAYIGGAPLAAADLRLRLLRLAPGHSPDGTQTWFNWTIRLHDGTVVGRCEATLDARTGHCSVAWLVGTPWQGRGYAREAAAAMVGWLADQGCGDIHALIHPDHEASMAVARAAGLHPTDRTEDGETLWRRLSRRC